MTNLENGVFWITGDSVWGRVHSNDNLTVSGSPVYLQKVTTSKGFIPPLGKSQVIGGKTYTNKAIFMNPPQPETGVARIDFPTDMSALAAAAASANGRTYTTDIWVTLDGKSSAAGDGKAYIRKTQTGPIIDSVNLADPNFNGVIMGTGVVERPGNAGRAADDRIVQHADGHDEQRGDTGGHSVPARSPLRDQSTTCWDSWRTTTSS